MVGGVLLAGRMAILPPHDLLAAVGLIPALVIGGVGLSIIPAAIYALLMELWLSLWQVGKPLHPTDSRATLRILTILLSTLLGAAAGMAITWVNQHPFVGIGALTGLILGIYLVKEIFPDPRPKPAQP
jgi:ribose/xylose/arabinose/galactoside ABC-type transport system permease subunit